MENLFSWLLNIFAVGIGVPVTVILITTIVHIRKFIKKGYRRPEYRGDDAQDSIFKKIFIQFPYMLAEDFMTTDPNDFREYGLHMFIGKQGKGKTIGVVQMLKYWQKKYPDMKVYTNMGYGDEDGPIEHWEDLIKSSNGKKGIVNVLDEIHTWFSSNESKNFPPAMLGEISQQRKQRKCFIGTGQVFGKIAKPIREQTTFVYLPHITWILR